MRPLALFFILTIGFSCQKEASPLVASTNGEKQPSTNANCQSKTVNGYTIAVTYHPKETEENPKISSKSQPNKSCHFIMEIKADGEQKKGNFLYHEAYDMDGFKANVNYFNFGIINDVQVEVNHEPYEVVLSTMENTYTLADSRKIHFVAVPVTAISQPGPIQYISFVYDDTVLGVGKLKFTFHPANLNLTSNQIAH